MAVFALVRLKKGSLVNPDNAVYGVGGSSLTIDSAISSSLCGKAVVLQRKAEFSRSNTVSVAVQNMGGDFFRPLGNVSGIANNSSSSPYDVKH